MVSSYQLSFLHFLSARREWRADLSDYDGVVYLVDAKELNRSKEELNSLLADEALSKPILILGSKSEGNLFEELNLQETITKVSDSQFVA